jgi:hypothetical protein
MAAIPEQVGIKRVFAETEAGEVDTEKVNCREVPWAARESWARSVLKEVNPDVFVQDSYSGACQIKTFSCGLWPGAPQKVVGGLIESENNGFCEALRLNFGKAGAKDVEPASPGGDGPKVPAPFLMVLGGGGYGSGEGGEAAFLQKLELFTGLSQLVEYEKNGLSIVLGGQLAIAVLACFLGVKLGDIGFKPTELMLKALKDTLRDVLSLGVVVVLPADIVAWKQPPPPPPVEEEVIDPKAKGKAKAKAAAKVEEPPLEPEKPEGEEDGEEDKSVQNVSLSNAYAAIAKDPVSLGFVQGKECFTSLEPETGTLRYTVGLPPPPPPPEPEVQKKSKFKRKVQEEAPAPEPEVQEEKTPEGPPLDVLSPEWSVRDIGEKTCEDLRIALRRSRGVLWNGALGMLEDERFQKGTRQFLAHCGYRISGPDEDEDEAGAVDEEEAADEEEEEEGDERAKAEKEKEPEVEWETSLVIGRDSARMLPTLYDTPAPFAFESKSGETLLQILRGKSLPGLLACADKDRS